MGILAKKSGTYKGIVRPKDITELCVLDTVRIKPESFFDQYKQCGRNIVISGFEITEEMKEFFGNELEVITVDPSDDTFETNIDSESYWWPLSTIDYIDRS